MLSFFLAFFTGVTQSFLLNRLLKYALGGNIKKTLLFLLCKLALYGAVITLIVLFLKSDILKAATGFAVGLPGSTFALFLYNMKKTPEKEGDEKIGNG